MWTSEAGNANPVIEDHESLTDTEPVGLTVRRLEQRGLSAAEAGNLAAHLVGLPIVSRPWTVHQIEHVMFLRSLVEGGRLTSRS
jgi:hypothetical protein